MPIKRKEENSNITRPSTEEVVCVGICEGSSTNSPVSGLCWLIYCDLWWYNHYELLCPLSPFGDAQSLGSDHLSLLKIHFYNKLNLTKLIIMINLFNLQSNCLWWLCCPTLRYLYNFCWHVIVSVMCTL